jgi:hypothetical protein
MNRPREPELQWLADAVGGLIAAAVPLALLLVRAPPGAVAWLTRALGRALTGVASGPRGRPGDRKGGSRPSPC